MSKIHKRLKSQRSSVRRLFPGRVESLETRLLLAADWQNPADPLDVDAAESAIAVTPLDALLVINEINVPTISDPTTGRLPELNGNSRLSPPYVDVNADGFVSPLDALLVINELNADSIDSDVQYTSVFAPASVVAGSRAALDHGIFEDTLVNTATAKKQRFADVAADSSGNMVMVWESFGQDGTGWGVYGQRYTPDGEKLGEEFRVNSTTNRSQRSPSVAMDTDGGFMVVWQSLAQDGSSWGVYGQEYDSDGNTAGDESRISETTRGGQLNPAIAGTDNGYFVVWEGRGQGDRNGIFARRVGADVESGDQDVILVNNTMTDGNQARPAVDVDSAGNAFVVWQGKGEGDWKGIFMKPLGSSEPAIPVNIDTSGGQSMPAISIGGGDEIVVAWQSGNDILMRPFTNAGEAIGTEILVNQTARGAQKGPTIDHLADGGIVVGWYGKGRGDRRGAFARSFDSSGNELNDEMLLNHTTRAGQIVPSIAAVNDGYVALWQGRGTGDHRGIFARFIDTDNVGPFEIGDVENQTVDEGQTVVVDIDIIDLDGIADTVTFAIVSGPDGAMIDANSGVFTWVTDEADGPSVQNVEVSATGVDVESETFVRSTTFQITVNEVNVAPVLDAIGNQAAQVGMPFTLVVNGSDADLPAQTLTFGASGLPSWLNFDPATRTFSGTPQAADIGAPSVTATLTDSLNASDSETFTVTVTGDDNNPPTGDVPNQTATVGTAFTLNVSGFFSDPDSDSLTFTTGALPAWLNFSGSTFTGTPAAGDVGAPTISVTATDPGGGSVSDTFTLTVTADDNDPPVGDIPNQSTPVDVAFSLNVSSFFSDPNGDPLTFTTGALPGWLGFTGSTFTGTPAASDVGPVSIAVTATDPDGAAVNDTFLLTVAGDGESIPVLSDQVFQIPLESANGTVVGTMVGADADPNTTLEYQFVGALPSTAFSIDQSTGEITVTDAAAVAMGTFNFTVEVSDGGLTDSATATIIVSNDLPIAAYTLSAETTDGDAVTSLEPGQEFDLVLSIQDIRAAAQGIFSAYADIVFPSSLVAVTGTLDYSPTYAAATSGDFNTPGLIDETGAVDGITALGGNVFEVVRVRMQVATDLPDETSLFFATNETEDQVLHPTLVFQGTTAITSSQIAFGSLVIQVQTPTGAAFIPPSALSASATITSTDNARSSLEVSAFQVDASDASMNLVQPLGQTEEMREWRPSVADEVFRQLADGDDDDSPWSAWA